jgi:hypothetical protein
MFTSIPVAKENLRQKNIHRDGGLFAFLGNYASQH